MAGRSLTDGICMPGLRRMLTKIPSPRTREGRKRAAIMPG